MEQLLLMTHKCIVDLSAGFAKSRMIWFSHLAISPPVAYARRFNSVIRFGQEYDAILFSQNDLETTIAGSNQDMFAAEAHLASRLFPAREKEIDSQVRQAVFQALTRSDECNRQSIARRLGFQERTLNRHLHKKGTSFEAIRDEVRRNLAYRYLARADLTLSDIAGRLGYSELAVLSRCCQRWFGSSPRQLRQSLVAARLNADSGGKLRPEKSARPQHDRLPEMKNRWPSGAAFRARQPISML
jgi:AraC-like DNA-binding protein